MNDERFDVSTMNVSKFNDFPNSYFKSRFLKFQVKEIRHILLLPNSQQQTPTNFQIIKL